MFEGLRYPLRHEREKRENIHEEVSPHQTQPGPPSGLPTLRAQETNLSSPLVAQSKASCYSTFGWIKTPTDSRVNTYHYHYTGLDVPIMDLTQQDLKRLVFPC
jgi:hypothetical protein